MAQSSGSSTKRVYYDFETKADDNDWQVRGVTIRESLSGIYTASVDLACDEDSADPSKLLGNNCVLKIERDSHIQRLCGIVSRVKSGGRDDRQILANVKIEPALSALKQRIDCRIFQEQTAVDIIEQILRKDLADYDRKFTKKLTGQYAVREYTVQYRESDFDFISRLMQYEGINYFFDHQGKVEELMLVDSHDQYPKTKTSDGDPVPFLGNRSELATTETVGTFAIVSRTGSTDITVRDFDWTRPLLQVESAKKAPDPQGRQREVYEADHLNIGGYKAPAYSEIDNDNQAKLLTQGLDVGQKVFFGAGFVTALRPGEVFELVDHPQPGFDGKYLLTEVNHIRPAADADENTRSKALESYENRFKCILFDDKVPFRPVRSVSRPTISGPQTAIVVGPKGEDVFTDEHARIKVQFHWDRLGKNDEKSSCWVRVAQSWAGPGYGTLFIPRIGMEVVVTFLEGDPDRPLVTGCVYNGTNGVKNDLEQPKYKTRSAIRTSTAPGAKGYNELRFEDIKGGEEIFVHAQKDYNEVVENNHDLKVHKNQSYGVDGNQTISVGGNRDLKVQGNKTTTVQKGNETTTVQKGNKTATIAGEYKIVADKTLDVLQNATKLVLKDGVYIGTPGDLTLKSTETGITLKSGAASIHLSAKDGKITIEGAGSKIEIGATGVNVTGPLIKLNS
jgi:type VI secretion system secreted protein VgrG